jgi:hypothetical protein
MSPVIAMEEWPAAVGPGPGIANVSVCGHDDFAVNRSQLV